ncbi:MAG: hydroxymethylbilane synthase [Pseudomonadota bacterium]
MLTRPFRIGTRGSPLALAQAYMVQAGLAEAYGVTGPDAIVAAFPMTVITTSGDKFLDRPLKSIGGKGLFTKEIEAALLADEIDLAVHSMKDVPTQLPEGLEIACILPREDVRDGLISGGPARIADLPEGARIGTASLRRQAVLRHLRPDLKIGLLRGNVGTRLGKVQEGEIDATLLAMAGLNRLGQSAAAHPIEATEMLPAVAQGAVGLEIRSQDSATRAVIAALNDAETALAVACERGFLAALDGSCRTPIAALARRGAADGETPQGGPSQPFAFDGAVYLPDGTEHHTTQGVGDFATLEDAEAFGRHLGAGLKAGAGEAFWRELERQSE